MLEYLATSIFFVFLVVMYVLWAAVYCLGWLIIAFAGWISWKKYKLSH